MVRASGATTPAGIPAATRRDRAILAHGFIASRSCSPRYPSLAARRALN